MAVVRIEVQRGFAAVLVACVWALVFYGGEAKAAPGDLDPGFGRGGVVTSAAPSVAQDLVSTFSGRTYILLRDDFRVLAFAPDGSPVEEFEAASGVPGKKLWSGGTGVDLSVAADGTLLAVGYSPDGELGLVLFGPDGQPQESFGPSGRREVEVDRERNYAVGGRISRDGLVTAFAGFVRSASDASHGTDVYRFERNGDLDSSFGSAGVATIVGYGAYNHRDMDLVIDSGGRTLVAGSSPDPFLARLTPAGELDDSFSAGGVWLGPSDDLARFVSADIDSSDRPLILWGNDLGTLQGDFLTRLKRLTPEGETDPTFDRAGHLSETLGGITNIAMRDLTILDDDTAALAATFGSSGYQTDPPNKPAVVFVDRTGELAARVGQRGVAAVYPDDNVFGSIDSAGATVTAVDHGGRIARFRTDQGPADRDADGRLDSADACPGAFSRRPRGCPRIKRQVAPARARRVGRNRVVFTGGLVAARSPACANGADRRGYRVNLFKKRRGPDRRIERSFHYDGEPWSFEIRGRKGRYYAKSPKRTLEDYGLCLKAKSRAIRPRLVR